MKKILTLIFICSLIYSISIINKNKCFKNSNITFNNLIEKNNTYYEKTSNIPYTGEIIEYYKNRIARKGFLVNGKKEGVWEYGAFHSEEAIIYISYKNNLKEGFSQEKYLNGQVWSEGYYHNDCKSGVWQNYYEDGRKSHIKYFFTKDDSIKTKEKIAFTKKDTQENLKNGRYFYKDYYTTQTRYDLYFRNGVLLFGKEFNEVGIETNIINPENFDKYIHGEFRNLN